MKIISEIIRYCVCVCVCTRYFRKQFSDVDSFFQRRPSLNQKDALYYFWSYVACMILSIFGKRFSLSFRAQFTRAVIVFQPSTIIYYRLKFVVLLISTTSRTVVCNITRVITCPRSRSCNFRLAPFWSIGPIAPVPETQLRTRRCYLSLFSLPVQRRRCCHIQYSMQL